MNAFVSNGVVWGVIRVPAGDPRLVDHGGTPRIATTDPTTHVIAILDAVEPPLLDRVVLHEVTHAIVMSWGVPRTLPPAGTIDELFAQLMEGHALEAVQAATIVLGRPVCVNGLCGCLRRDGA